METLPPYSLIPPAHCPDPPLPNLSLALSISQPDENAVIFSEAISGKPLYRFALVNDLFTILKRHNHGSFTGKEKPKLSECVARIEMMALNSTSICAVLVPFPVAFAYKLHTTAGEYNMTVEAPTERFVRNPCSFMGAMGRYEWRREGGKGEPLLLDSAIDLVGYGTKIVSFILYLIPLEVVGGIVEPVTETNTPVARCRVAISSENIKGTLSPIHNDGAWSSENERMLVTASTL
ncbi:UNVERIFIED_CONTAM: hypothetical protein HDU68_001134, partial [Siphonaria sp. JEL0065]